MAPYLAVPLDHCGAIRSPEGYRSRSYNQSKQVIALVDHLFVRYRVPFFLYRAVLSYRGMDLVFETSFRRKKTNGHPVDSKYRPWFLAVARGESFAKTARDTFTKKEAHWFLQAPGGNSIERNILWAKAAASGVPLPGCDFLVERLDDAFLKTVGDRLPELLRFYAEAWPQMRGYDRDEITDFIRTAVQDRRFSFKGRTFGSMRKLCHEWHRTVYSGTVREYRSWNPIFPLWEFRHAGTLIRAEELTNNRALNDEGRVQKHCVFTYTELCRQGQCAIVSLRWCRAVGLGVTELDRLTLEVIPARREVVQIRGKLNARATEEQMKAVRHWAGDLGLKIAERW